MPICLCQPACNHTPTHTGALVGLDIGEFSFNTKLNVAQKVPICIMICHVGNNICFAYRSIVGWCRHQMSEST